MKHLTYLLIDFSCIIVPFLASFHPKLQFYKEWRSFFGANIIVTLFFLVWDYIFTAQGVWGFNPDYLLGVYVANLPIEEVLFFVCIPYSCVFTYYVLRRYVKNNPFQPYQRQITIGLLLILVPLSIVYVQAQYTFVTFALTSIFLLYCLYIQKDMSYIYLGYLSILPFFFMSNGILTGSFLEKPVVWYNNAENMGIRMFTIPFEDTFYGFLMVALNVAIFEKSKRY